MIDMQDPPVSPPPSTPAPSPSPRPRTLGRLTLPLRGDRAALNFILFGVVFYLVAGAALIGSLLLHGHGSRAGQLLELLGLGAEKNYPIFGLIVLGVAIVLRAAFSVWRERQELNGEEDDVEWVNLHGREGLGLVFAPDDRREELFRRGQREYPAEAGGHVETLMDDRVRRMIEKAGGADVRVSPDELRGIAETRTARYGAFARYSSSLLLLLAVLGTFAGVKTALPGLIDAVSQSGAGGGAGDITGPLRAVADAFGGNALALVGAIAVGLMAQGLSIGRRHLLERLELVSTEFLYGSQLGGSVDPLADAVRELGSTAQAVRETGTAIAGVEDGVLALGDAFRDAFGRLNERLVEIAERQDEELHRRTSETLRELQRRVVDLAAVVEQNTRGYQGIVDTVGERAQESRAAIDVVRQSAASLQQAVQSMGAFQQAAAYTTENVKTALGELREGVHHAVDGLLIGGRDAAARMEAVAAQVERAQPAIDTVERMLRDVSERVATIDQRAAAEWKSAATEVNAQVAEIVKELRSGDRRGGEVVKGGGDPDVTNLLRRILMAVETEREPNPRRAAFTQAAGLLLAVAVVGGGYLLVRAVMGWMGW